MTMPIQTPRFSGLLNWFSKPQTNNAQRTALLQLQQAERLEALLEEHNDTVSFETRVATGETIERLSSCATATLEMERLSKRIEKEGLKLPSTASQSLGPSPLEQVLNKLQRANDAQP